MISRDRSFLSLTKVEYVVHRCSKEIAKQQKYRDRLSNIQFLIEIVFIQRYQITRVFIDRNISSFTQLIFDFRVFNLELSSNSARILIFKIRLFIEAFDENHDYSFRKD